jgi:hypothetical protein
MNSESCYEIFGAPGRTVFVMVMWIGALKEQPTSKILQNINTIPGKKTGNVRVYVPENT